MEIMNLGPVSQADTEVMDIDQDSDSSDSMDYWFWSEGKQIIWELLHKVVDEVVILSLITKPDVLILMQN